MSELTNCPFCDSSEEKIREESISLSWKEACDSLSHYFPNFTYIHIESLCDTCFEYLRNFLDSKKLWLKNEQEIQTKRQLGQFKGLKHIKKLKKSSSLVCRLCLEESHPENVIFIYLDNEFYQPGYIQRMMCLHTSDIDINLTENPVICHECLDVIQTFDALYQMTVENQTGKEEPVLELRNISNFTHTAHQEKYDEIDDISMRKVKNKSLVLHTITEEERAVSTLLKNKESSDSKIILNGCTMKNILEIMQKSKSEEKENLNNDIYVVSDEEEVSGGISSIASNDHDGEKKNSKRKEVDETGVCFIKHNHHSDSNHEQSTTDIIEINDSDEELIECPKIQSVDMNGISEGPLLYDESQNEPQINICPDTVFDNDHENGELEPEVVENCSTENSGVTFHQYKKHLEKDLSVFLKFKRSSCTETEADLSNTSSEIQAANDAKRMRLSPVLPDDSLSNRDNSKPFYKAFRKILQSDSSNEKASAWKFLRGPIFGGVKDDQYCIWFPYYTNMKKYYPSSKVLSYATVLEDRSGSRLFRCNVCTEVMTEESSISVHQCQESRKKGSHIMCGTRGCNFYTFNRYLYEEHMNAHILLSADQMKQLKCKYCNYFSSDSDCLEHHMTVSHQKRKVKGESHKCAFCFFQSENPDIVAHHEAVRHSDNKTKFSKKHYG